MSLQTLSRGVVPVVFGAAVLVSAIAAQADPLTYTAPMNGANEVPPVATPATGFSTVVVDGNLLTVDISWTGLIGGNPSMAHIHCCTLPGTNVNVAVGFPGFPATPSGTYFHAFDLLDSTIYTSSFLNNFGGGTAAGARDALIDGLNAGLAYTNIHNAINPGGEIRGLLVRTPEPLTIALFGLGLAATAALRRRLR